jgi:hypothetical protein
MALEPLGGGEGKGFDHFKDHWPFLFYIGDDGLAANPNVS